MDPEYYALTLGNGERLIPSDFELSRLARENARAAVASQALPAALRRLFRAGFDARPARGLAASTHLRGGIQ